MEHNETSTRRSSISIAEKRKTVAEWINICYLLTGSLCMPPIIICSLISFAWPINKISDQLQDMFDGENIFYH